MYVDSVLLGFVTPGPNAKVWADAVWGLLRYLTAGWLEEGGLKVLYVPHFIALTRTLPQWPAQVTLNPPAAEEIPAGARLVLLGRNGECDWRFR
jgi:hypothetical protein